MFANAVTEEAALAAHGSEGASVATTPPLPAHRIFEAEIVSLAVLALGGLMAEPLYVLVDTLIVGHLGRAPLAALGIAGVVLANVFANFNFLTYAATTKVGRAHGAALSEVAERVGGQALWLCVPLGLAVAAAVFALARPIVAAMGGDQQSATLATDYLRIAAVGLPFAVIAMGAQGYLRGLGDLKTPLLIIVAANGANVLLECLFVFGIGWGVQGSAASTAVAQLLMGTAVVYRARGALFARFDLRAARALLRMGRQIFVRSASLHAALLIAAAVVTRFGDASIAAHQIVLQLWVFLALALDAFAIVGQVIVARELGAGARDAAFAAAGRLICFVIAAAVAMAALLGALYDLLPEAFSGDAAVVGRAHAIWPIFVLVLPLSGAVYALDGILLGAGDARYLMWAMVAAAAVGVALYWAAYAFGWGIVGVWAALAATNAVRLATLTVRFRRRHWAVLGTEGVL